MMQPHISSLVAQAQQGDSHAIAQLLNQALAPYNITTKVSRFQKRLTIFADGQTVPDQESLIGIIQRGLHDLKLNSIEQLKVYGRKLGEPSTGWMQDVDLNNLSSHCTSSVTAEKSAVSKSSKVSLLTLLNRIQQWRPNKWVLVGVASCILLILLSYGGAVGANVLQARSQQAKTIQRSQRLLSEATIESGARIETLQAATERLKTARDLLRSIPNTRGSRYSEAQTELAKVRTQLKDLTQQIEVQEAIANNLNKADQLAREAIASVNTPPYPLETWKAAQQKLEDAIRQLEAIPDGTPISEQVNTKLANYRQRQATMTQSIAAEEKATQTLLAAERTAQQAMAVTEGRHSFEVADLQNAQKLWQQAIAQLKQVPDQSYAFRVANNHTNTYTSNLGEVTDGIEEIQDCVERSILYRYSFTSCDYVYLNIRTPTSMSPTNPYN